MNNKEIDIEYEGFTNQATFEVWFVINNNQSLQRQALAAVKGRIMSGQRTHRKDEERYMRQQSRRLGLDGDSVDWKRVNWPEIWEYFKAIATEEIDNTKYVQFTRRTNEPKLAWIEQQLEREGIKHRRQGESWHAPILEVEESRINDAWAILTLVDDIEDDDPQFEEMNQ